MIELLVVIAIIGLLSGVVVASLSTARAKARDSERITELKQLETALEMYFDDFGGYPLTGGVWFDSDPLTVNGNHNGGNWIPGPAPTYIPVLPRDPRGGAGHSNPPCGAWGSSYLYRSTDVLSYTLLAHCSPERPSWPSNFVFYDSIRPTWGWKVCRGIGCGF